MAKFDFPLQFLRQYQGPLDADLIFNLTSERTSFLTNPRRFAGMMVYDQQNSKTYVLDSASNAWLEVPVSSSSSEIQLSFGRLDVDNIRIDGNNINNTGANGSIGINPSGTGHLIIGTDLIKIGDQNLPATITTRGTGTLTLNTNDDTNSGSIVINQGTNGNIAITPNGTGEVDISKVDIDSGTIDGVTIGTNSVATEIRVDNLTLNGNSITSTDTNGNIAITPNGSGEVDISKVDIDSGSIDGVTIGTNSVATEIRVDNLTLNGNSITSTNSNGNIAITPNGSGEVDITKVDIDSGTIDGVTIGTNSVATEIRVDNLTLNGNSITSTDTNGNIAITPNGSGEVDISKVDIDSGSIDGVTIGTNSVATEIRVDNLTLNGNSITSTNSNGNIAITPNGSGEVDISKVDIDSGTIDGVAIGNSSVATIVKVDTITLDSNTITTAAGNNLAIFPAAGAGSVQVTGSIQATGTVLGSNIPSSTFSGDIYYKDAYDNTNTTRVLKFVNGILTQQLLPTPTPTPTPTATPTSTSTPTATPTPTLTNTPTPT